MGRKIFSLANKRVEIFMCKVYFVSYIIPVLNWFNLNWSETIKKRFREMGLRGSFDEDFLKNIIYY